MNRTLLFIAAGSVLGAAVLGYAASRLYLSPAASLRTALRADRADIASFEQGLEGRNKVGSSLAAIAATTLGATEEEVDARLRNRLNEIAGGGGLTEVVVESNAPVPVRNPAGERIKSGFGRTLRGQTDFRVVRGSVTGTGPLEKVMRALATFQSQPWVHRVESFSVKPVGKERDRFELRVGVATLMMPDLLAQDAAPPPIATLSERDGSRWAAVVTKNVFKEPPAPPPAPAPVVVQASAPAAPPPSPYAEWRLTGVVESRLGIEAWLRNSRSGQTVALPVGGEVASAKLVSAGGERAVFEIDGKRFEVTNGQALSERRPLN